MLTRAAPRNGIPLRHALGCCGSNRDLLPRFAAHLLDEPARTRFARDPQPRADLCWSRTAQQQRLARSGDGWSSSDAAASLRLVLVDRLSTPPATSEVFEFVPEQCSGIALPALPQRGGAGVWIRGRFPVLSCVGAGGLLA